MDTVRHLVAFFAVVSPLVTDACSSSSSNGGMGGAAYGGGANVGGGTSGAGGSTSPACHAPGVLTVTNQDASAYVVDGAANPTLTLCRGSEYTFAVNATGHPFYIKTVQGTGIANAYDTGVTGNGADMGDVTFVVPAAAPGTLYYDCSIHAAMRGTINIVD